MSTEVETENDEAVPGETKVDRFKRIGTRRLRNVLNQMRLLGNCANTTNYEFTPYQVDLIFTNIDKAVQDLKNAFEQEPKVDDLPSL